MILVTGHIRLAPEAMERVRPQMRAVIEATRREDGCIVYAFGEDAIEPGVIRIVERWRDWAALAAHGNAPHLSAWREALREIGVIDREVTAHETGAARSL